MLRRLRIGISALLFVLISFFFPDFAEILPNSFHRLAHLQFIPAILSLSIGILLFLIVLTHILKPAFMEYGLAGMMQPTVSFEKGFCNFDCTVCGDVCPNGAILPISVEQKHLTHMGYVVFIEENCIVYTDGTSCGACSEHCPTQAVAMVPYKDGLTIPHVNKEICVGCGGCEYVCPARPFRAIYIEGNPVQKEAKPFKESEEHKVEIDDFGF